MKKGIKFKKSSVVFEPRNVFDDCVCNVKKNGAVVYSYSDLVKAWIKSGMTEDEAIEWIDYNVVRAIPYMPHPQPQINYTVWVPQSRKK